MADTDTVATATMNKRETARCDIILTQMPYTQLGAPSIALSLLKAEAIRGGLNAKVVYSSHRFAQWLGYDAFTRAERSLQMIIMGWEILFAKYAGFKTRLTIYDLLDTVQKELGAYFMTAGKSDTSTKIITDILDLWGILEARVPAFLENEADFILSHKPRIIGSGVMTQQRNATFALMKTIKERAPEVITIIGGGEFIGKSALACLDAAPQVDFIFTGEGDSVFADACKLILEGRVDELGLCFPSFLSRGKEPKITITTNLNCMAVPDYSDYFAQMESEGFGYKIYPRIMLEGSRGCWWGEVERCGFCGMHYSKETLTYREKHPDIVWKEIWEQISRYGCNRISFTDCILSRKFIHELPDLSSSDRMPYIFAECKSNLIEDDIRRLRNAGFFQMQPGIEALQDDLLELMHKGNRAVKHIELLKHMRRYGIRASWNLLHSLPGDKPEWYGETIDLIPFLHHLEPPVGVNAMILMRCSLYNEQAQRYGLRVIVPQTFHFAINPDEDDFTRITADLLFSPDIRRDGDMILKLNQAVAIWKHEFMSGARLDMVMCEDRIEIHDSRKVCTTGEFTLTDAEMAVFNRAYCAVSLSRLHDELDSTWGKAVITRAIDFLYKSRLAVLIRDELLALALPRESLPYRTPPKYSCNRYS